MTRPQLPSRLLPPPLAPDRVARVTALAVEVRHRLDQREPCGELLDAFNRETGRLYGHGEFGAIYAAVSADTFAETALSAPPVDVELSRQEAIAVVEALMAGSSERESTWWLAVLEKGLDQPHITDLVYWPRRPMTAEEVVDAAALSGEALAACLDPMAAPAVGRASDEAPQPPSGRGQVWARDLLSGLIRRDQILLRFVSDGLTAAIASHLSRRAPAADLAEALVDREEVAELFATDEELAELINEACRGEAAP